MENIYKLIAEKMEDMSKSQLKIAKYILENPNNIPFFTVGKLARMTDVSDATVVRFATFLGFSGYPELQQKMQQSIQKQLTTTERLKMSNEVYKDADQEVYNIFLDNIENIKATIESLDLYSFRQAVKMLCNAKNVYIVANRSALSLGIFMQYYLQFLVRRAELIHSTEFASEQLYTLGEEDLVIGISFSRYTKSTIDIFSYAKKKKANTIAITDNHLSPLIQYADVVLTASSHMPTFIDSFVAPLSLINALLVAVGRENQGNINEKFKGLEEMWEEFDVFYK
ncbi:MurR/RpiR family transcriptional regulator [Bacillus massiliigorillae]|uniref:MurR/RpiR family transcriptional regulator n=1 Tax=Bacillus massiliigorillae TaxID=1243664 RepID=UPI0003A56F3F|nr:MurR/RpiR family transcriptional regulator [Bacillus massiliigorillae]